MIRLNKRSHSALAGWLLFSSLLAWAGNVSYTYDDLNRLIRAEYDDGTVIEYTYDAAGNRLSQVVRVPRDTTPPTLSVPSDMTAEATGPSGAAVAYIASATDAVDGPITPTCTPTSGSTFALGTTAVNCSATDKAGNTASGGFNVTVRDTTPPTVTVPADIVTGPTGPAGAKVSYSAASATDLVDGGITPTCAPASGSLFGFGTTSVNCSATDSHGNTGSGTFKVTVNGFTFLGFVAPVDNVPALNTVKNGSTVPVKWKLQGQGGVEITDVGAVAATWPKAIKINCADVANELAAPVETTMTGGTSLRYDTTAMQFVYNWQTPKQINTCWRLDIKFTDGTMQSAHFKLK